MKKVNMSRRKRDDGEVPAGALGRMTKSRMAAVLVVLVVVISLVVYAFVTTPGTPSQPTIPDTTGDDSWTTGHSPSSAYTDEQLAMIVENSYQGMRESILGNIQTLALCVAVTEMDASFCEQIVDTGDIDECKQNYNLLLAYKNECDAMVPATGASIDFDATFCERLNSMSCDGLGGNKETVCDFLVEDDIALCLQLPGAKNEGCTDYLNIYRAVHARDGSYCSVMSNAYKKILCEALLAGDCLGDVDRLARDYVYYDLAEEMENSTICNKISNGFLHDSCASGEKFLDAFSRQ